MKCPKSDVSPWANECRAKTNDDEYFIYFMYLSPGSLSALILNLVSNLRVGLVSKK